MCRYLFALIFSLLLFAGNATSQISHGGKPYFKEAPKDIRKVKKLSRLNKSSGISGTKSMYQKSTLKVVKYAEEVNSEYDILKTELSDTINNVVVKRLTIESEGAYSLSLHFNDFELTHGAKLFIYNEYKTIGSFTYKNNKDYKSFATQAIPGDNLTVELSYPLGENPILKLDKTYHGIKDIFRKSDLNYGTSASCNVNINCPEGDEWQLEKRAICQITSRNLLFTGVLINTSEYDATPYVLTAMHAIKINKWTPKEEDNRAQDAIFYFGYESLNCDGSDLQEFKTTEGSELIAMPDSIDFALLKLSSGIPSGYNPVFAGININGYPAQKSVCIHHPDGDIKKISTNEDPVTSVTYTDQAINVLPNSHWLVESWEKGTTEGGSSGCPLFDENHLVVGTLSGGGEPCSEKIFDNFSKITFAWNYYNDTDKQLAHWLNSSGKDLLALGAYAPYGEKYIVPIAMPAQAELENGSVFVYANIYGEREGVTYEWDFGDDASPSISTGTGPFWVKYSEPGVKSVKVKIFENGSLLTEVVDDNFVSISKYTRIVCDKNIACEGEAIRFDVEYIAEDLDLTHEWDFGEGANPQTSDKSYDIQVKYNSSGFKTIKLNTYRGEELVESIVKYSYLNILEPPVSDIRFKISNNSVSFNNYSLNADSYLWDFGDGEESLEGEPVHNYNEINRYNVILVSSRENCAIKDTLETFINLSYCANFKIYPNPSNDIVKLDFRNIKSGNIKYWIFNIEGKTVSTGSFNLIDNVNDDDDSGHIVTYDVSNIPAGIYYIRIAVDNKMITKKMVVGN